MRFDIGYNLTVETYDKILIQELLKIFCEKKELNNTFIISCFLCGDVVKINCKYFEKKCNKINWISYLILICKEEIICKIYKDDIIFHGSVVNYKNKNILFIGQSKSGKSTAVFKMAKGNLNNILTDDLTILNNEKNKIILPKLNILQLRDSYCNLESTKIVNAWNTGDVYLTINNNKIINNLYIDAIILIRYNAVLEKSSIIKINGVNALKKLMKNIFNILFVKINKIIKLCQNIPIYEIEYKNDLEDLIDSIIK